VTRLPDRVTVLRCIACGAMGRQERCEGACSEHKLVLVSAEDHDALLATAHAAHERAGRMAEIARAFVDAGDAREALVGTRERARQALRDLPAVEGPGAWDSPATVTGWWCAECGNVDLPQPCIGVCVWLPSEWVSLALYERELPQAAAAFTSADRLAALLRRLATVTPRPDQVQRNYEALRAQAVAALAA
jgi:hypothetical protein